MILVVSTCKIPVSEEEFVNPIIEIIREGNHPYQVKKYRDKINFRRYSKIIICGTALKDFDYLNYIDNFKPIINYNGLVLGICAGYQILAKIYSNKLDTIVKIGVYKVRLLKENPLIKHREFQAYFLHIYALRNVNDKLLVLAEQGDEISIFKVKNKNFYGVAFHPEVLNREIIESFLRL